MATIQLTGPQIAWLTNRLTEIKDRSETVISLATLPRAKDKAEFDLDMSKAILEEIIV